MGDVFLTNTNTGSFSFTNTALYSTGALPANGDTLYLVAAPSGFSLDQGLSGFGTNVLARLVAYNTFLGNFGGAGTSSANIPATTTDVSLPAPDGSGGAGPNRWNHNNGTNAGTWNVYGSAGSNADSPQTPVTLSGSNAANVVNLMGGVVGIGVRFPNEGTQFPTIRANGGQLFVGSGLASGATIQNGGATMTVAAGGWTGTNSAGSLTTRGTYSINALTIAGGTVNLNNRAVAGTSIGTLNLYDSTADFSGNPAPVSIGATVLRSGSVQQFLPGHVTLGTVTVDTNGNGTFTVGNS